MISEFRIISSVLTFPVMNKWFDHWSVQIKYATAKNEYLMVTHLLTEGIEILFTTIDQAEKFPLLDGRKRNAYSWLKACKNLP